MTQVNVSCNIVKHSLLLHQKGNAMTALLEKAASATDHTASVSTAPVDSQLQQRTARLLNNEIRFVYVDDFESLRDSDVPVADIRELLLDLRTETILAASAHESAADQSADREWQSDDPLLTFEQEQFLFRAMNLLRYRANCLRSRLSVDKPSPKMVARAEEFLDLSEEIRGQLVRSNLRLVGAIARKFSSGYGEVDDCSSDGCMILLGAIDRFDYSRGYRFSTYATHSIQRYFFRAWKVHSRRRQKLPCTSAEVLPEVAENLQELPICSDPQAAVENLLQRAPEVLDERELWILRSRFGLGSDGLSARTLREIAADLGVSKERVRQLQIKAMDKLKAVLNPAEFNVDAALA